MNKCLRCNYEWRSTVENPKSCPNCKRYDWNRNKQKIQRAKSNFSTKTKLWNKQNKKCNNCGNELNLEEDYYGSYIDHIIPLGIGGEDKIENMQLLCFQCNSNKNSKDISEMHKSRKVIKNELDR